MPKIVVGAVRSGGYFFYCDHSLRWRMDQRKIGSVEFLNLKIGSVEFLNTVFLYCMYCIYS